MHKILHTYIVWTSINLSMNNIRIIYINPHLWIWYYCWAISEERLLYNCSDNTAVSSPIILICPTGQHLSTLDNSTDACRDDASSGIWFPFPDGRSYTYKLFPLIMIIKSVHQLSVSQSDSMRGARYSIIDGYVYIHPYQTSMLDLFRPPCFDSYILISTTQWL